jgi:hypothetical protein
MIFTYQEKHRTEKIRNIVVLLDSLIVEIMLIIVVQHDSETFFCKVLNKWKRIYWSISKIKLKKRKLWNVLHSRIWIWCSFSEKSCAKLHFTILPPSPVPTPSPSPITIPSPSPSPSPQNPFANFFFGISYSRKTFRWFGTIPVKFHRKTVILKIAVYTSRHRITLLDIVVHHLFTVLYNIEWSNFTSLLTWECYHWLL